MTVHPRPETLPILIPVTISTPQDLANLQAAAEADPGYLISVYTYRRSAAIIFDIYCHHVLLLQIL